MSDDFFSDDSSSNYEEEEEFEEQLEIELNRIQQEEISNNFIWENLEEEAHKKLKEGGIKNPKIYIEGLTIRLESKIKKEMGDPSKLKGKKRIEFRNLQKHLLFNCIRKILKEKPKEYEYDKQNYFESLSSFINNKGKIVDLTNKEIENVYKCSGCSEQLYYQGHKAICKRCGIETDINQELTTFNQSQQYSKGGSKDISEKFLNFKFFIGPQGFQARKEYLKKITKEYLETLSDKLIWTDEKIDSFLESIFRKVTENTPQLDIKKMIVNEIVKELNIEDVYKLIELYRYFKLNIKEIKQKEEKDQKIDTFNEYFQTIQQIQTFRKWKDTLISINEKYKGRIPQSLIIKKKNLSYNQKAAIVFIMTKKQIKNSKKKDINKFIQDIKKTKFIQKIIKKNNLKIN